MHSPVLLCHCLVVVGFVAGRIKHRNTVHLVHKSAPAWQGDEGVQGIGASSLSQEQVGDVVQNSRNFEVL